jgi:DNA-binding CsgD family transcriptional regulator
VPVHGQLRQRQGREAVRGAGPARAVPRRLTLGWASLTPTERDVVRLVSEGLANNDIATRLFVSPRTVQTHLTHVYNKLGLTSRVQLAQEAARTPDTSGRSIADTVSKRDHI